jgi:signal transduction histidine kinase
MIQAKLFWFSDDTGIAISLPMIKQIIPAHRGKIEIESGHEKGFVSFISLPQ